jgi:hypothetical protein
LHHRLVLCDCRGRDCHRGQSGQNERKLLHLSLLGVISRDGTQGGLVCSIRWNNSEELAVQPARVDLATSGEGR